MSRNPNDRLDTWPAEMVAGSTGPMAPRSDRYETVKERGRGGLGRVLEARDRVLRRSVAVKELLDQDLSAAARFAREAFITARLQHPSIVPMYDAGTREDGSPFYVMKLVSGRTLDELVDGRKTVQERLALLPNVVAVADALAYAHSEGFLHRDIKGSNVIVGDYGETIVIDWGIAKRLEDPEDDAGVARSRRSLLDEGPTVPGEILGTPHFMAPEQGRGDPADTRTDVWALGALLYFVLTCKAPYEDSSLLRMLAAIQDGRPKPVREREPNVPRELAAIVEKAMAAEPAGRYPSAREFADDLRRFQSGSLVSAYRYKVADRCLRGLRRHAGVALVTGAFVLLAASAAGVLALREQRLRLAAEQARDLAARAQERADRQSLALIEQQGRDELEAGRPFRAVVLLSDAYTRDPDSLAVRFPLTEALKPLAAHRLTFVGHERDVPAGAYSPDGAFVATGSDDRTVRIWDAHTGIALHTIEGFVGALEWVSFSHDGTRLAVSSAGQHPRVSLWDVREGRSLAGFDQESQIFRVEFSPDDSALVLGGFDGSLSMVDLTTGRTSFTAPAHKHRITSIRFRPGSDQVFVGSLDRTGSIWNWRTHARQATLGPLDQGIWSASYSRDGRFLLVGEEDRHVQLYDATSLARLRTFDLTESSGNPIVSFSPDSRRVIVGTEDGLIRILCASSGALLRLVDAQPTGHLYQVAVRGDGNEAVTTGGSGEVNLWSLDVNPDYRILGQEPLVDDAVLPSQYLADGHRVVLPSRDGTVRVVDTDTDQVVRVLHVDMAADTIAIGASDSRLATVGERADGFPPRVWDLEGGSLVAALVPQVPPRAYGLAVSGDGSAFFTGDYVGNLREWEAATGKLRAEHSIVPARISSLAVHPDGRTIAVASEHGDVYFVDRVSGETTRELKAHGCWINAMTFGDQGRALVTVGRQDATVKVWREPYAAPIVLSGHRQPVQRASLSEDGRFVASASSDSTVRLWDSHSGELLRVIRGPSLTAAFHGNDEILTTGEQGYEVVWDIRLDPRSPSEVARYVAERSPWRLEDGHLVLAKHGTEAKP